MKEEPKDGGPTFPSPFSVDFEGAMVPISNSDSRIETIGGMTLLDYFAGQALAGMYANGGMQIKDFDYCARTAYKQAGWMLRARKELQ